MRKSVFNTQGSESGSAESSGVSKEAIRAEDEGEVEVALIPDHRLTPPNSGRQGTYDTRYPEGAGRNRVEVSIMIVVGITEARRHDLSGFALFAILATATGFAEMANRRYLKLPTAMGLVIISMLGVGVVLLLDAFGVNASEKVRNVLPTGKDFQEFFIDSSLALMLYAAATSIDAGALRRHALPILFFATIGTLISVILVAIGTYYIGVGIGVAISPERPPTLSRPAAIMHAAPTSKTTDCAMSV